MEFVVSKWRAWCSGISDQSDWQGWRRGEKQLGGSSQADVSFLPAMQRRRLSPLAKAVFNTAFPLLQQEDIPLLLCSVHGEAMRTYSLLQGVAASEDLSPTAFGLSVHNAIAGQFSIACKTRSPALALAGGDFPMQSGFIEAAGLLQEGAEELLLVFCEETLPEMYYPSAESSTYICATAMRLAKHKSSDTDIKLSLTASECAGAESVFAEPDYQLPLIRSLIDREGRIPVSERWELQINAS
ncbi:beta-ketoacyl synthase chain length factor [Microbulbifer sp. CNSA002]|uniref:beta-ketoacyl synthase chain length factor n=1 Tax=unclassified Microbulbifer TaxID=2619833 RepID=UPI0039B6BCB3